MTNPQIVLQVGIRHPRSRATDTLEVELQMFMLESEPWFWNVPIPLTDEQTLQSLSLSW